MAREQVITIPRLLELIAVFRARIAQGRQSAGGEGLWAATVEIAGLTCRGLLVDLAPAGLRLSFVAKARSTAEMVRLLPQLDGIGAKVICERRGNGGLHLVLAPESIAARAQAAAADA